MGLNESFEVIKDQILMLYPLPQVNKTYSMLQTVESKRNAHKTINDMERSVLMVRGDKKKDAKFCDYCKMTGHVKQTCFKLIGIPDWYKDLKTKKGPVKQQVNMIDEMSHEVHTGPLGPSQQEVMAELIKAEMDKYFQHKYHEKEKFVNVTHLDPFELAEDNGNAEWQSAEGLEVVLDQYNEVLTETSEAPSDLLVPLLKHQKEWLAWALKQEDSDCKGGILADEMGMGNILEAIALVLSNRTPSSSTCLPDVGGTLVICPVHAIPHWVDAILRYTSRSIKTLVYINSHKHKSTKPFFDSDFVITTWSTVQTDFKRQKPKLGRISILHSLRWKRTVWDEAHAVIHRPNFIPKAVYILDSTYKWALRSTLMQNTEDLYSAVWFLKIVPYSCYFCNDCECKTMDDSDVELCPDCTHNSSTHSEWWYENVVWPIQHSGNSETRKRAITVLNQKILKTILIRRTKEGRAADLGIPPTLKEELRLDYMDARESKYYKSLSSDIEKQVDEYYTIGTPLSFDLLMRLQQAVDHPDLVMYAAQNVCSICHSHVENPADAPCANVYPSCPSCSKLLTGGQSSRTTLKGISSSSISNRIQLKDLKASTKIEALKEEINLMLERDGSAKGVVISQFVSFLDVIHHFLLKWGIKCVQLVESMSEPERNDAINSFTEDPDFKIFLVSLRTGATALNLTVASNVFLMEPCWNTILELQAIDRIYGVGQCKATRVVRFIIASTIEERILNKLPKKTSDEYEGIVGEVAEERLSARRLTLLLDHSNRRADSDDEDSDDEDIF